MTAHHWIAHFPVALIVTGTLADALGALGRDERPRRWATPLLVLGSAAALMAFFTGSGALLMMRGGAPPAAQTHAEWGGAAVWPIAASGALRLAWRSQLRGGRGGVLLAAALVASVVVILLSRSGMAVSHGS